MTTNNKISFFIISIISLLMVTGCKKDECKVHLEGPSVHEGSIVAGALVDGHDVSIERQVVRNGHATSEHLEVSFNDGYSYEEFISLKDAYVGLNFPVYVSCDTKFHRKVSINPAAKVVTYTLTVISCETCESTYLAQNWVIVPKFSEDYVVNYIQKVGP